MEDIECMICLGETSVSPSPLPCFQNHLTCESCVLQTIVTSKKSECTFCKEPFDLHDYFTIKDMLSLARQDLTLRERFIYIKENYRLPIIFPKGLTEKSEDIQKEFISRLFWGSSHLYENEIISTRDKKKSLRIKRNLVDITNRCWEKNDLLKKILVSGALLIPLEGETNETFFYRCGLFARHNSPYDSVDSLFMHSRIRQYQYISYEKTYQRADRLNNNFNGYEKIRSSTGPFYEKKLQPPQTPLILKYAKYIAMALLTPVIFTGIIFGIAVYVTSRPIDYIKHMIDCIEHEMSIYGATCIYYLNIALLSVIKAFLMVPFGICAIIFCIIEKTLSKMHQDFENFKSDIAYMCA